MKLADRIARLESRTSMHEPPDIIHVIIDVDRSIIGALRHGPDGEHIPVDEAELAAIRAESPWGKHGKF
ncbi:MAG: hypothetical protein K2P57_05305 [Burkholderiales bacterium]|nr:hypothetical protein [Burkholderiales bacterium]